MLALKIRVCVLYEGEERLNNQKNATLEVKVSLK